jgi:O-antigen ligase
MTPSRITGALAIVIVLGEWTGLARGIVGTPAYAALLDIALVGLALAMAVRAVRSRDLPRVTILTVLVAAYMVVAAIEILNPNVPSLVAGLEGYRKTAFTMLAFFIVVYSGDADAGRFFRMVAVGSVPAFLWATRQFVAPLPVELNVITSSGISSITFHAGPVLRAFSPTAGPFHLGVLGGAVVIIAILTAVSRRWPWLIVAATAGLALGLSLTRGNLIATLGACFLIALTATPIRAKLQTAAYAAVPLGTAAVAALFAIGVLSLSPSSIGTIPTPGDPGTPSTGGLETIVSGVENPLEDKNMQFRFKYWQDFAESVAQRPLIGYGTSAAADGFDRFYQGTGSKNFEPHSVYFKAALELGLGGLILLLGIFGCVLWSIYRAWDSDRLTARTVLGLLAIVAVAGITGPMLDAYPMNLLFWASCGWIAVAALGAASRNEVEPSIESSASA